jgi:hypothetical protein
MHTCLLRATPSTRPEFAPQIFRSLQRVQLSGMPLMPVAYCSHTKCHTKCVPSAPTAKSRPPEVAPEVARPRQSGPFALQIDAKATKSRVLNQPGERHAAKSRLWIRTWDSLYIIAKLLCIMLHGGRSPTAKGVGEKRVLLLLWEHAQKFAVLQFIHNLGSSGAFSASRTKTIPF